MAEETKTEAPKEKPKASGKAIARCIKAMMRLGVKQPHFLLTHSKLRDKYVEMVGDDAKRMTTMAISNTGKIYVNEEFISTLTDDELGGVIAHEILHLVYLHHMRVAKREAWLWNVATDMCINSALKADGITLPKSALLPPSGYTDELHAEELYDWLVKNSSQAPAKPKIVVAGAGCSISSDGEITGTVEVDGESVDVKSVFSDVDLKKMAAEMKATAEACGRGSSAVASLLTPRPGKIPWKKVLRQGFSMANTKPGRDFQTYSKRNRRSPPQGVQFPGWKGFSPSIAICIDVSGSMSREWINNVVGECMKLMQEFAGTRVFLTTHTSEVCFAEWINTSQAHDKFGKATAFSGGTDPNPAYEAIRVAAKGGKLDVLVHMTDTFFFDQWPEPPARKLVVGVYGGKVATQPPKGSTVMMMEGDE